MASYFLLWLGSLISGLSTPSIGHNPECFHHPIAHPYLAQVITQKVLCVCLVFVLSACGTLDVGVDVSHTPVPELPELTQVEAALTPVPTYTPTLVVENPSSSAPSPTFSDASFFTTRSATAHCDRDYGEVFPGRVRQIYAQWKYANMHPGLMIRREWYRNGELWAQRNVPWDFTKYGAHGTLNDISIYDFDAGLEPGDYELRLYIDGQLQFDPGTKTGFRIHDAWTLETTAPNGRLTAIITDRKLMIREADGTEWELLNAHEISSVSWFSDSRHLLYGDTDRSQAQGCSSIGIRYRLWVVDSATAQQHQIGTDQQNLHRPMLSHDERYIAALRGSGWYDACMIDLGLTFIALDDSLQEMATFELQDFTGIPAETSDGYLYPYLENGFANIGVWKDATHFETGLGWLCGSGKNLSGIYLFNMPDRQAVRVGDLAP